MFIQIHYRTMETDKAVTSSPPTTARCQEVHRSENNDGFESEVMSSPNEELQAMGTISIESSYDYIMVTIATDSGCRPADKPHFQMWCATLSGKFVGKLETNNNKYCIGNLEPNTTYSIKIDKHTCTQKTTSSSIDVQTLFCSHPIKFMIKNDGNGSFSISWKEPLIIDKNVKITAYCVQIYDYLTENLLNEYIYDPKETNKKTYRLNPIYSYIFIINAKSGEKDGRRVEKAYVQPKHRLIKDKEYDICIEQTNRKPTYVLTLDVLRQDEFVVETELKSDNFASTVQNEKVILLLGETGSGKTTWINAFVNFLLSVEVNDNFRFKIINESNEDNETESQTDQIIIYRLRHHTGMAVGYNVTVIDTPGFGDTRGSSCDEKLEDEIRTLFKKRGGYIDYISTVALVMPGDSSRLTPTHRYILNSILTLFGKDLEENLLLFATHAPGKCENITDMFKAKNIKLKKTYHFENYEILKTKYYTGSDECVCGDVWDSTMKNFRDLCTDLEKFKSKSVTQTNEVLEKRDRIRFHANRLREDIEHGIKLLEQYTSEKDFLCDDTKEGKHRPIIRYVETVHIYNSHGRHNTYCSKCDYQCHEDCPIHNDKDLNECIAMDCEQTPKRCKVCPNKCPWNEHRSVMFSVERTVKEMVADVEYISKRRSGNGIKLTGEKLRERLKNDFNGVSCRVKSDISEICDALKTLKDVALLSWPKSEVEVLEQIIKDEEREMQDGYTSRIQLLKQFQNEAMELKSVDSGNNDPFGSYRKCINDEIEAGENVLKPGVLDRVFKNVKATLLKVIWLICSIPELTILWI